MRTPYLHGTDAESMRYWRGQYSGSGVPMVIDFPLAVAKLRAGNRAGPADP